MEDIAKLGGSKSWSGAGSGAVIGGYFMCSALGMAVFRHFRRYEHSYKALFTYPCLGRLATSAIFAFVALHHTVLGAAAPALLILCRFVEGTLNACQTLCAIEMLTLTSRDRVSLQASIALLVNLGIGSGILAAGAVEMRGQAGHFGFFPSNWQSSPASIAMWGMSVFWLIFFLLGRLLMQESDPVPVAEIKPLYSNCPTAPGTNLEGTRKMLICTGIMFVTCRAFVTGGIDSASMMILETQFGWARGSAAAAVACCYLSCIVWHGLFQFLRARMSDEGLLTVCISVSTVASLGIFDFAPGETANVAMLLLADSIIFPLFMLSSGIVSAYVTRSPLAGDWLFGVESVFVLLKLFPESLGRGLGPVAARTFLSGFSRNHYSAMQLSVCVLSSLLWHFAVNPCNIALEKDVQDDALSTSAVKSERMRE